MSQVMRRNLSLLFIGIFSVLPAYGLVIEQKPDLLYQIQYEDTVKGNCLAIKTNVKGNLDGKLLLRVPPYVTDAVFNTPGKIAYQKVSENVYEFTLDPNNDLSAQYKFCNDNKQLNIDQPIIRPDFIHILVEYLLITPENEINQARNVKIDLSGMPKEHRFLSNYSNKKETQLFLSIYDLRRVLIAGGNVDIKTIYVKKHPVYIMTKGKWTLFDKDPSNYVEKLITAQRKFWQDYDFPHYAVIIFKPNMAQHDKSLLGTHKENILTMAIPEGDRKNMPLAIYMLSHELFHAWMGNRIQIPLPQGHLQWFIEGVNDYYGLELALRAGVISQHDYIDVYNKILGFYENSPVKNATNDEIAHHFKSRGPYGLLAQFKGHILFKELSNKFPNEKVTENPIDNAMREIYREFGGKGKLLNEKRLGEILEKHVGVRNWQEAQECLNSGATINASPNLFQNYAYLEVEEVPAPKLGFDLEKLVKTKKIKSLDMHSNAYKSGLRENQTVLDYSFILGQVSESIEILVEDKDSKDKKIVLFVPDTVKKKIPQYRLLDETV